MSRHRSPEITENGIQGNGYVSPRVFGAKANLANDDTSAIQQAINAAAAFPGGGTVVLDGRFRTTSALTMDMRVSLLGTGAGSSSASNEYGSAIFVDSATEHILSWTTGPGDKVRGRISNLLLGGLQTNNSSAMFNATGVPLNMVLDNVCFNEDTNGQLRGRLLDYAGVASKISLRNCRLHAANPNAHLFTMDTANARLSLSGCELLTTHDRGSTVFDIQSGLFSLQNNELIAGPVPGAYTWVDLGATARAKASGNTYRVSDSNVLYAFSWAAGAVLIGSDNVYESGAYPTAFTGGGGVLGDGSKLSLIPHASFNNSGSLALAAAYDILTLFETTVAPTYTLPAIAYKGQTFRLNIKATNASGCTPTFSPTPLSIVSAGAIPTGGYGTYVFQALDMVTKDTFQWHLISTAHT